MIELYSVTQKTNYFPLCLLFDLCAVLDALQKTVHFTCLLALYCSRYVMCQIIVLDMRDCTHFEIAYQQDSVKFAAGQC